VHQSALVRGGEAVGDLRRELQRFLHRKRAAVHRLAQGLAIDVLHGHERPSFVVAADLVDGHDVRVVQRRCGARFVSQAEQVLGRFREMRRQQLDRDLAAKLVVVGEKDFTHGSRAKLSHGLIGPDARRGLTRCYAHDSFSQLR
jgi:hypothetical protein